MSVRPKPISRRVRISCGSGSVSTLRSAVIGLRQRTGLRLANGLSGASLLAQPFVFGGSRTIDDFHYASPLYGVAQDQFNPRRRILSHSRYVGHILLA